MLDIPQDKLVWLVGLLCWRIAPPPAVSGGRAGYYEGRVEVRRDSDPSEQVGTMGSQSADRRFQSGFHGFCEGCSAANRGPLRPRFAPLAIRWVV